MLSSLNPSYKQDIAWYTCSMSGCTHNSKYGQTQGIIVPTIQAHRVLEHILAYRTEQMLTDLLWPLKLPPRLAVNAYVQIHSQLLIINSSIIKFLNTMVSGKVSYIFSTYFIINVLLVFAYPLLRYNTSAGQRSLKLQDAFGFTYENSIIYTVLALTMIAYTRSTSTSQFFVDFLTVGKVGVACLLFFAKFQFCLYYIAINIITWLVIPYPRFEGKNNFIRVKSEEEFEQFMGRRCHNRKSQKGHYQYTDKMMYMVEFHVDWVLPCTFAKQIWYGFSNRYQTKQLGFLSINASKLGKLAEKYRINTSGFSKQLPTVIMFEDGEEKMRFPPIDKNDKVGKVIKYDYKILLRYFDLESRYIETR